MRDSSSQLLIKYGWQTKFNHISKGGTKCIMSALTYTKEHLGFVSSIQKDIKSKAKTLIVSHPHSLLLFHPVGLGSA